MTPGPPASRLPLVARRYGLGVVLVLVSIVARMATVPTSSVRVGYLVFYPAVVITAWYGGLLPGLLTTGLAALAIMYFWIPPTYSLRIADPNDVVTMVVFVAIGIVVSALSEKVRQAIQHTEWHAARLDREIRERVKAQATVTSLAR